jgi:hypothetical protein
MVQIKLGIFDLNREDGEREGFEHERGNKLIVYEMYLDNNFIF